MALKFVCAKSTGERAEYLVGMAERVSGRYDEVRLVDGENEIMAVHLNGQLRYGDVKLKALTLHEGLKFIRLVRLRRMQKVLGIKGLTVKAEQLVLEFRFEYSTAKAGLEYQYDTKAVVPFLDPPMGWVSFVQVGAENADKGG